MKKFTNIKSRLIISICALLFPLANISGQVFDIPWISEDSVMRVCTDGEVTYDAGIKSLDTIPYFIPNDPVRGLSCIDYSALTAWNEITFQNELRYVPAWFIFRIEKSGLITIGIEHSFNNPENPDFDENINVMTADVDFICWGPFLGETKQEVLSNIYSGLPGTLPPVVGHMCSSAEYSDAKIEKCTIEKAKADEWYLLLITNRNQKPGKITFSQIAGSGSVKCEVKEIVVKPKPICEGGPLTLTAEGAPVGATFKWEVPSTVPPLTNAQKASQELAFSNIKKGVHDGVYSVTMNIDGDEFGPYSTDPIIVNPTYNMPAVEATIKRGESYTFEGNTYTEPGPYSVTLKTVNVDPDGCDSTRNLKLTVLEPVQLEDDHKYICESELPYTYTDGKTIFDAAGEKEITIKTGEGVPDEIVKVILHVDNTKPVITSLTSSVPGGGICGEGEEIKLNVEVTPSGAAINWTLNDVSVGSDKLLPVIPSLTGNANHSEYTYTVKASFCNIDVEESITVFVDRPIEGEIAGKSEICRGSKETLLLNAIPADADSYRWTTENGLVELGTGVTYPIKPAPIYNTTYRVEMARGICKDTAYFEIKVADPPKVLRIDSIGYLDREIVPDPNYGAGALRFGVNNLPPDENPKKYNLGLGKHTFYIIDESDCRSKDTLYTIKALQPVFPAFFTPNGDGVNDTWEIKYLNEYYPDANVEIYDRSGRLLAKYKGSVARGWDGTFNGEPVPTTDYWYLVSDDGLDKVFVGHFTLRRR